MRKSDRKTTWSLLLLALTSACHGSDETGGWQSTDAGSAEATDASPAPRDGKVAANDATVLPDGAAPCLTEIGSCPWDQFNWWKVLIDAGDFGDRAHFVSMGGQATLVALPDGSYRVALLDYPRPADNNNSPFALPGIDDEYDSWALPSDTLQPIAVTEGYFMGAGTGRSLFVLACDEERAHCRLSRADVEQGELSAWQHSELPAEFRGRNLVFDWGSDLQIAPYAICAYGNGLVCLRDGEWRTEIPASADLTLNDVEISVPWSLAVGERGRWFKRERVDSLLGPWQEQPSLGQVSLTQVTGAGAGAVILGDGRIQAKLGDKQMLYTCGLPDELLALFVAPFSAYPEAVTPSREVYGSME